MFREPANLMGVGSSSHDDAAQKNISYKSKGLHNDTVIDYLPAIYFPTHSVSLRHRTRSLKGKKEGKL